MASECGVTRHQHVHFTCLQELLFVAFSYQQQDLVQRLVATSNDAAADGLAHPAAESHHCLQAVAAVLQAIGQLRQLPGVNSCAR